MAERIGSGGVSAVADLAEEKALWGRFGLSG
jgi:serine protease SohB